MIDRDRYIIGTVLDDWVSDFEIQGAFRADADGTEADGFQLMVPRVLDWIRRGVLVPGDLTDDFRAWPGTADERATEFGRRAAALTEVKLHGDICWFDPGPNARAELGNDNGG